MKHSNKNILIKPVGKKIVHVKVEDLVNFGLSEHIANNYSDDYQLRILKSTDKNSQPTLQGIVILTNSDIGPLRTHEIVNIGGGKIGFVEDNKTYGGFGAFHVDASDFGIKDTNVRYFIVNTKGNPEANKIKITTKLLKK